MPSSPPRSQWARVRRGGVLAIPWLLLALALLPAAAAAQPVKLPEWITTADGFSSDADQAFAVGVDSAGDVLVAGVIFDLPGGPSLFVMKLDGGAGTEVWSEVLGTGGALSLAIDASDDVLVAGNQPGAAVDSDLLVVKLDGASGSELWRTSIDGGDDLDDVAFSVAVEQSGDVVAAGYTTSVATGADALVVKLDGATGAELWRGVVDGGANDDDGAAAVALDGVDVVAAGRLRDAATQSDVAVIKYLPEPGFALGMASGISGLALLDRWRRRRSRPARTGAGPPDE